LRNGVKKQLNIYDGDNPDELCEKFAKENNINSQKQKKLKEMIQKEIEKFKQNH